MNHWNTKRTRLLLVVEISVLITGVSLIGFFSLPDHALNSPDPALEIVESHQAPVTEISALTRAGNAASKDRFVAFGDKDPVAYTFRVTDKGLVTHKIQDFSRLLSQRFSLCSASSGGLCRRWRQQLLGQWEGAGRDRKNEYLLKEYPPSILRFDHRFEKVGETIKLDFRSLTRHGQFSRKSLSPNNLGEGLLLLKNGHVLVAKERHPVSFIEFGPAQNDAEGYRPDLAVGEGDVFPAPETTTTFKALAVWKVKDSPRCDMSDVTTDSEGRLYALSETCRKISSFPELRPGRDVVTPKRMLPLPPRIERPEALALVSGGSFLVGSDLKYQAPNIFLLRPDPSATVASQ